MSSLFLLIFLSAAPQDQPGMRDDFGHLFKYHPFSGQIQTPDPDTEARAANSRWLASLLNRTGQPAAKAELPGKAPKRSPGQGKRIKGDDDRPT